MIEKMMRLPVLNKLDRHMREIVQVASVAFALKVLAAAISFAFNIVVARMLQAEGTGMYFLALTVTTFASVLGRIGLDNALLRFTASNAADGNWDAVKGVYIKGLKLGLIASGVVALGMFASAPLLANFLFSKPELTNPLRFMAVAVIPLSLSLLYAQLLKGLKRIRDAMLLQGVWVPTFSLLFLAVFARTWGVMGAVWAYILGTAVSLVIGIHCWHRAAPQLRGLAGRFETRELLRSSIHLLPISILQILIKQAPIFILGIWANSADVGIFGVAFRTAVLLNFILTAVSSIAAPKFAALYSKRDIQAIGRTARGTARLMTLMSLPLLALYLLIPGRIMGMFGPQFVEGALILSILAVGQFVNVITGAVQSILMMTGNERAMRNAVGLCAVISFVLNVALIKFFGLLGAAIAAATTMIIENVLFMFLVWSRLGIWTLPGFRRD